MFKGSGVAIITPFNNDGSVNYDKLKELLEFQIESGTDAIIICGTTGEASTLNEDEKKEIIKYTVNVVNKKIPVIAGTGTNNTAKSVEMSKYVQNVGVDGLLIVTPYYNKCSQEGIYLHFKEISDNVDIPIIAYNVPSRTGLNIEPSTLLKLSTLKNVKGIKEASGNISQITYIASIMPKNFYIYSGNDDQTLPILSIGGAGVISVAANIIPKQMHNLCFYFMHGKISKARKIQLEYLDLMKSLFTDVNPIPIKEAMNILEMQVGNCRLPLCSINSSNKSILTESLSKIKL